MPPEEVHGSAQGPNGERLNLTIGSKSIGLSVKDLFPILLLLAGLVGGYLVYVNVMDAFKLIYHRQEQVIELVREQTEKMRRLLLVHDANQDRPAAERMPLELDPPHTPKPER